MNRPDNRSGMNPIERQRILRLQRDNARFNAFGGNSGPIFGPSPDDGANNTSGSGNIDGGFAASIYLVPQLIDGGQANNGEPDTNPT
jgi:hypothetical protein